MILIYLSTGAPGEGDQALEHAPDEASVFTRTTRGYSGPESDVSCVYADDEAIQTDYEAQGVEVRTLDGGLVAEGSEDSPEEETTSLADTSIGSKQLQDMSREELYEVAQDLGIEGRSDMDKDELFQAIRDETE